MKELNWSKRTRAILYTLGAVVLAAVIFRAGIYVGFHQGNFLSQRFSDYQRFGSPRSIYMPFMMNEFDNINPHGAFGTVASVKLPTILVKGPKTDEQVIMISTSTIIRKFMSHASSTDIKAGDEVVIIGEPNENGSINASFIRIMPEISSSTPRSFNDRSPDPFPGMMQKRGPSYQNR